MMQKIVDDDVNSSLPAKAKAAAAAIEVWELYPTQSDDNIKMRAIEAFGHLTPLMKHWSRPDALRWLAEKFCMPKKILLGKKKPTKKEIDNYHRHIRRVEKIHNAGKWGIIEHVISGTISLEMAEYAVNHPSLGLLEAVWIAAEPEQRQQFLARKKAGG